MKSKYPVLSSPIRIGCVEIPNRTAMMPMGVLTPRLIDQKYGAYTKDGADYYISIAKGGTGLIITGLIPIVGLPILNPLGNPSAFMSDMKYLMDGIHEAGSKIFVQLTALQGRTCTVDDPIFLQMFPSPTPMQNVWDPTLKNRGITKDEIHLYVKNFGEVASLVQKAGGDGVEIHATHEGYLLDQFAISFFNHRTDEYGGSLENRLRFAKEIVKSIKEKCGKDFPVSMRYSVRSYIKDFNRGALPGEEFEEKGRDLTEALEVAKMLESFGYDVLNCDNGSYDSWYWSHPPMYMPKACNLEDVAKVKEVVNIPVICAGRFDVPQIAEEAIGSGKIDMMGMGRALLADHEFVNKMLSGNEDDIRPCIGCHQGCLGRIFQHKDISCAVNPVCGREETYTFEPTQNPKRIMVVGGGLGGMEVARVAALRGHTVDLFEKNGSLGGVFIAAAAPDFKKDDKQLLVWYEAQLVKAGVNVQLNTEVTATMTKAYDEVFVATGANERRLDTPGFDAPNVSYAVDALLSERVDGKNIVIVGGGLTGCELAYSLSKEGKQVTVVERSETILNVHGLSAANYNMLMELMDYYKVKVIKNAVVDDFTDGVANITETIKNYPNNANRAKNIYLLGPNGMPKKHIIPADHIVVSVGYTSNQELYQEIAGDHVHLLGDAKQPSNIMDAIWAAYDIARFI